MRDLKELTVVGGYNKFNKKENIKIVLNPGDIVSIVGENGSGKSQLLEDIQCLAQGDTVTKRKILINSKEALREERYSVDDKLVEVLKDKNDFLRDLTVEDYILMRSTNAIYDNVNIIEDVIECANQLVGERLKRKSELIKLSKGQVTALTIACVVFLSFSPILLIEELESKGIDKIKAINLLLDEKKILILSTKDLILSLIANKRIVVKDGGIEKIVKSNEKEKENLNFLFYLENQSTLLTEMIRKGESINFNIKEDLIKSIGRVQS